MNNLKILALLITLLSAALYAEIIKEVKDEDIKAGQTVTWSSDTVYLLTEKVFVESTAVLNIQAGTIIKGKEIAGDKATALIICRGAKIFAKGTKYTPIIFTCESDDIGNLNPTIKGKWGGVVILGQAVTNQGVAEMEGLAPGDARAKFGGTNDADNSGALRYVSIRHSGATVAPDNELNGLSLGAVGTGTTLEYIEAYASSDDGFEWWGGTVNGYYLVSAFCDDDAFDIDQGYRGTLQFLFAIQDSLSTNNSSNWAGEWDGQDTKGATPFGTWAMYNATFIGGGSTGGASNGGILIRENGAAVICNSIFTTFRKDRGVVIEDLQDASQDSRKRFDDDEFLISHNIFWNCGSAAQLSDIAKWTYKNGDTTVYAPAAELAAHLASNKNSYEAPKIKSIAWRDGKLDPTLTDAKGGINDVRGPYNDAKLKLSVTYKGAFGTENWAKYWTAIWDENILAGDVPVKTRYFKDKDINAGETVTLYKDTTYLLTEKVFVESGATLIIQPGTWIKGLEETGEYATALVICRGGKIIADGRADAPIVLTCESDDPKSQTDLTNLDKGKWGGLVILGSAVTNEGEDEIEGIASGDPRVKYGGSNNADSSGILRYVSVRHAGATLAPDNELNGIGFGAVGSKTVLDHVEVFASSDDGFEWWGGAVNGKYLIAAYCDDDCFDIDQGYQGNLQFLFSIQDSVSTKSANWAGEWDGDDTKEAKPFGSWSVANATMVGGGRYANLTNGGILIRANGAAKVYNSIICNFPRNFAVVGQNYGLVIEDLQDASQDSWARFKSGDIYFGGNIFSDFDSATVIDSICRLNYKDVQGVTRYPASKELTDSLVAWKNLYADPKMAGIDHGQNGKLIPQPGDSTSPAYDTAAVVKLPSNGFFATTNFKGAFASRANNDWTDGWSFISEAGYMGTFSDIPGTPVPTIKDPIPVQPGVINRIAVAVPAKVSLQVSSLNGRTTINFSLPATQKVNLSLYNAAGCKVATLFDGTQTAGQFSTDIKGRLSKGLYFCRFQTAEGSVSKRFAIVK